MKNKCLIVLLFLWTSPASAWGPEGHEVVAHLAARELSPAAKGAVSALLGGEADTMMSLDANWADEIRADRPDTSRWHFVNIELDEPGYDPQRDCRGGNCVVAQIARDQAILASHASVPVKAEALRFLIHFVADIHQPLHAADHDDRGGNDVQLYLRHRRTNLHHLWDDDVVAAMGRDPAGIADGLWASLSAQQKQQLAGGGPADWANESLGVARGIYGRLGDAADLPPDYAWRENAVARLQLERAGLRLAALLNKTFR